jgi:hypothetical protein
LVAPVLAPGEELVATVKVNYNGTVPPNILTVGTGATGIPGLEAPATPAAGPPDPDLVLAFPTANQMVLALTGGRIFGWALGVTGKPKQFVGEIPLSAIERVDAGDNGHASVLRVFMKSTAIVDLEFMHGEPAAAFVEQLTTRIG